jgi:hypothetical protein
LLLFINIQVLVTIHINILSSVQYVQPIQETERINMRRDDCLVYAMPIVLIVLLGQLALPGKYSTILCSANYYYKIMTEI